MLCDGPIVTHFFEPAAVRHKLARFGIVFTPLSARFPSTLTLTQSVELLKRVRYRHGMNLTTAISDTTKIIVSVVLCTPLTQNMKDANKGLNRLAVTRMGCWCDIGLVE